MSYTINHILKEEALWKNDLPHYTFRESQAILAEKIYEHIIQNSLLVAEAGTGIGKTLSYLVPIFLYLENHKKFLDKEFRILISTETKTLQNQIYFKDIPLLKKILNIDISKEICFGSNNYVCLLKLQEYLEKNPKLKNEKKIQKFLKWLNTNSNGILSHYPEEIPKNLEPHIQREPNECLGTYCPNFKISYYFLEKEKWKHAKILVTNHHLLSTHLIRGNILPKFQIAILDEAHFFPEIFRETLSETFSIKEIFQALSKIKLKFSWENQIQEFYNQLELFLQKRIDTSQETRYKISKSFEIQGFFEFINLLEKAKIYLEKKIDSKKNLFDGKESKSKEEIEYEVILEKIEKSIKILNQFYDGCKSNTFHYIEKENNDIRFCISYIDIGNYLRENFIYKMDSVIFLSATLAIHQNFGYFLKKIGLEKEEIYTIALASPYDYKKQCKVYIPLMSEPTTENFLEESCKEILKLIQLVKGNTLVLFTSKKQLIQTYQILLTKYEEFFKKDFEIISQEKFGVQNSLNEFLKKENTVLLGLNSFRQGIDIPNNRLKCVILVKLPFPVPTDPFISSLLELEKEKDQNGFLNILLPEMLIKLKQGMGRLIRSERDQGIISILDSRIYTKSYGKIILEHLKDFKIFKNFAELENEYSKTILI